MEDGALRTIKKNVWYTLIQRDHNPYQYERHLMLISDRGEKEESLFLELWSNRDTPIQPKHTFLGKSFFKTTELQEARDDIVREYKDKMPLFIKKIFDPWAR